MQARGDYIRREINGSRIVDGIPARLAIRKYSRSLAISSIFGLAHKSVRSFVSSRNLDWPAYIDPVSERPTIIPSYHESVPERALASARNSRFADESEFAEVRAKDQRTINMILKYYRLHWLHAVQPRANQHISATITERRNEAWWIRIKLQIKLHLPDRLDV